MLSCKSSGQDTRKQCIFAAAPWHLDASGKKSFEIVWISQQQLLFCLPECVWQTLVSVAGDGQWDSAVEASKTGNPMPRSPCLESWTCHLLCVIVIVKKRLCLGQQDGSLSQRVYCIWQLGLVFWKLEWERKIDSWLLCIHCGTHVCRYRPRHTHMHKIHIHRHRDAQAYTHNTYTWHIHTNTHRDTHKHKQKMHTQIGTHITHTMIIDKMLIKEKVLSRLDCFIFLHMSGVSLKEECIFIIPSAS